jgi:hypothetical protein
MDIKELEILFPIREVSLSGSNVKVEVKPLSLENLPKVADSFGVLMRHAEAGDPPSEIASKALGEVLKIIPYCINIPAKYIPASDVPDILEIVISQNINENVLGKWMALIEKMKEVGEAQDQSSAVEKVKSLASPK